MAEPPGEPWVPRTVTFIRHAETEANAQTRWQGSTNAPLTVRGRDQIERLRRRLDGWQPDVVVSSDLERTMLTADVFDDVRPDPQWREFHVGAWEGLTSDEVRERFPGQLEALFAGEDIELGGGERLSTFAERVITAYHGVVDELDDDQEAVVVAHGGVIWALASHILGQPGRSPSLVPSHNTALSRVRISDSGNHQLEVFNDATHLDEVPRQFGPAGRSLTLIRHGQTFGNVEGRWQGRSDSPLTDVGRWQVMTAADRRPGFDEIYTSPLGRTRETAAILSDGNGVEPVAVDGLVEMSFGSWENCTVAEAKERDPELFERIYGRGEDEPRGGDGESFGDAGRRMASTLADLAEGANGSDIALVSHGAAIRAYATNLMGLEFADRNRLPVPRNSSMSRIIYNGGAPIMSSYNVAPHLD